MKLSKLIAAGILAAGAASVAHADTYVRFTGSTAYRTAAVQGIQAALASGYKCAYNGSSFTGANDQIFQGTVGGTPVIIKCHWSGSEAGIQAVAQDGVGLAIGFLPDVCVTGGSNVGSTPLSVTDSTSDTATPDVAMSDTFQNTSQFNSSASINISGTTHTYASLVGANSYTNGVVGVVPFKWIASNGGNLGGGTMTNMTAQLAKALYTVSKIGSGGGLQLSLFTGSSADNASWVFPVGRNPDSGTRLTAFGEVGLGALKAVTQYQPQQSSGAVVTAATQTMTQIALWPADVVNGISVAKPNSGYSSGGQLGAALGLSTSSITTPKGTGGILVGYLSTGDAGTALAGLGKELTYNGVAYSLTAVQQGQYSFWGYEHCYYRSGSPVSAIANAVAAQIHDTTATVSVGSMAVNRSTDGSPIVGN